MYGNMWRIPAPDVRRTDYFVVMGANPHASQGSLLACPDLLGEIDGIRERGGKTVVIDPRRTGTADQADEWIPIVPGTDAAFLLADRQRALRRRPRRPRRRRRHRQRRRRACRALCRRLHARVGRRRRAASPPTTIRRIAHEIAAAPTAAVYGRIGLCNQEFGTLASWLIDVVNILTGNFDRAGRADVRQPDRVVARVAAEPRSSPTAYEFGRWRSRVRGAPEVLGQVPVSCLAEEIATPGDGQIKALDHDRRQPGDLSAPDAGAARRRAPDARVHDQRRQLPQRDDAPRARDPARALRARAAALRRADLVVGDAQRRATSRRRCSRRRRPPARVGDPHPARRAGRRHARTTRSTCRRSTTASSPRSRRRKGLDADAVLAQYAGTPYEHGGPERLLDLTIRTGPWGDRYGENPDGLTLAVVQGQTRTASTWARWSRASRECCSTPSGKVELAPRVHHRRRPAPARRASTATTTAWCSSAAGTCGRTTRGCTT